MRKSPSLARFQMYSVLGWLLQTPLVLLAIWFLAAMFVDSGTVSRSTWWAAENEGSGMLLTLSILVIGGPALFLHMILLLFYKNDLVDAEPDVRKHVSEKSVLLRAPFEMLRLELWLTALFLGIIAFAIALF